MIQSQLAAVTFVVALIGSFLTTPVVIRLAKLIRSGRGRREKGGTVPRFGGAAVIVGFGTGVAAALWISGYSGDLFGATRYHWIGWIGAVLGVFFLGLVDDLIALGPAVKASVQVVGSLAVYWAGFRIEFVVVPWLGTLDLGWLALPLTVFWIVGVTNAINLIDGLDGLATGIAFLATASVAVISYHRSLFPVTVIAVALAGSLLGFLRFNFSPARIYLGDSGSQFLGFTLAVISIRGLQKSATAVAILIPLLVLGLPLLDTVLVMMKRTWRIGSPALRGAGSGGTGRRPRSWRALFQRDREHIHYNLLELGLSQRRAALLLYSTTALFCAAAFVLVLLRNPLLAFVLALIAVVEVVLLKGWAIISRNDGARVEREAGADTGDRTAGPGSPVRGGPVAGGS